MNTLAFDLDPNQSLRWSGHETFALRYPWLPKAYGALLRDDQLFVDEDAAMVTLGIGKNMVRSLKFWIEAMDVAQPVGRGRTMALTPFAHAIFDETDGKDPYLEDVRTLWLLHWKLGSRDKNPLFAWRYLISHWPYPEFTRSQAFGAFQAESQRRGLNHSDVTLNQHLDVFLHTYHRARGGAGIEDSLDGPLVDLQFIGSLGVRQIEGGRWEPVYAFRREPKPQIGQALFDYCLHDYWRRFGSDQTLSFRTVAVGPASPGQVFKLPEDDMRARLEATAIGAPRGFGYQVSAVQGLLSRNGDDAGPSLDDVYAEEVGS